MQLTATVNDGIWLTGHTLPIEQDLRKALTVRNPGREKAERYAGVEGKKLPPEYLCSVRSLNGQLHLPRGAVSLLRNVAKRHGVRLEMVDQRKAIVANGLRTPSLRPYQQAAVDSMVARQQGQLLIPCGGGKTRCGMAAIGRVGQRALVLVHTVDLADQWIAALTEHVMPQGAAVGLVGDGAFRVEPVTVALIQSLSKWHHKKIRSFTDSFGTVILDEAHHVPAKTFAKVLGCCRSRYRFGLTATPEREDGLTPLLEHHFGPVLHQVTHEELIQAGALVPPLVRLVESQWRIGRGTKTDHVSVLNALHKDRERTDLVVRCAKALVDEGRPTLVLTGRVSHAEQVARQLVAAGVPAEPMTGDTESAQRRATLRGIEDGRLKCIVATSLADEGLDLPCLSGLVLAAPSRNLSRTEQRVGRVMRPLEGKPTPVVVDIVDHHERYMRDAFASRCQVYATVQAKIEDAAWVP